MLANFHVTVATFKADFCRGSTKWSKCGVVGQQMGYSSAAADVSLTGKNKMIDLNVIKIPWMSKATVLGEDGPAGVNQGCCISLRLTQKQLEVKSRACKHLCQQLSAVFNGVMVDRLPVEVDALSCWLFPAQR